MCLLLLILCLVIRHANKETYSYHLWNMKFTMFLKHWLFQAGEKRRLAGAGRPSQATGWVVTISFGHWVGGRCPLTNVGHDMRIPFTTRPGPPALPWTKDESFQRGFQVFLGTDHTSSSFSLICISFLYNNSTLRLWAGQSPICGAALSKYPHVLPPSPPHCHHPNWSTGDNRVLGRPSLERRAVCRRRKRSRRRRRRSLGKEKEEEERLRRKEEEEELVEADADDGPPVLVSAPLTLKVEVRRAIPTLITFNYISSLKVGDEAFLPCFVSRLGTCQVALLMFLSIHIFNHKTLRIFFFCYWMLPLWDRMCRCSFLFCTLSWFVQYFEKLFCTLGHESRNVFRLLWFIRPIWFDSCTACTLQQLGHSSGRRPKSSHFGNPY